ncbi:MAG TPA: phosphoenolpyruvate synthase [Candidatus Dormibacteraeota bacterium]|nr:phosphoenolpyruvate synthase [Candidatus Dormibacteraeota bacterium]
MTTTASKSWRFVRPFATLTLDDIPLVGGKNASFGEMIGALTPLGVRVPDGFALTSDAYRAVLDGNGVRAAVRAALASIDPRDVDSLRAAGATARRAVREAPLPPELVREVGEAYAALSRQSGEEETDVAVRSSATAEDLPTASFAGQQETYLNVSGVPALLEACRKCFASLFTDRAISYRTEHGFEHDKVYLSIGVQKMVRSDLAGSGVMFTLDTESGFDQVVFITAIYGLGENIVQGVANPDEHLVFKPTMAEISRRLGSKELAMVYDPGGGRGTRNVAVPEALRRQYVLAPEEVLELARYGMAIETHYTKRAGERRPMDIEWGKDGRTQQLFILQARPETAHARRDLARLTTFTLDQRGPVLVKGRAVGTQIGAGPVIRLHSAAEMHRFRPGAVLVAAMTDPDWEPILKHAAAIITDHGGRTCHAAIVSRELGVPCVVGTGNATVALRDEQPVTVTCAEGETGLVMEGALPFRKEELLLDRVPQTRTKIYINAGDPGQAFNLSFLPVDGVGLAREEFIIAERIGIHPMALVHPERTDDATRREIAARTLGYASPTAFFVDRLAEGVARIAAAFYPRPVVVRLSDFKTNEYAGLLGGQFFEPHEENPMIGFRGASRYFHDAFREGFALECQALLRVRGAMGLTNVIVMVPFCRTVGEAKKVEEEMARHGLRRGEDGLQVYVMCEIPANVLCIDEFAKYFDGFSIGSNDLTQLVLGVDRDSEILGQVFDERDPAVQKALVSAVEGAHAAKRPIGICGQAPSDHPAIAELLVRAGIDSLSLSADVAVPTRLRIAELERTLGPSSG